MEQNTAFFAQQLAICLNQFASNRTNAVLKLLENESGTDEIVANRKYPDPPLRFNRLPLRTYYHYHDNTAGPEIDYGHFHIFISDAKQAQWAHLTGLAIDRSGQPTNWFCVNHWVTGEQWHDAMQLITLLESVELESQTSPVAQWLLSLLLLYRAEIEHLLLERDHNILQWAHIAQTPIEQILNDKSKYLINYRSINLLEKMQNALSIDE